MVTGDNVEFLLINHKINTAIAISKECGIIEDLMRT
jgi:magnesium-transporting ATPase (P-type)